MVVVVLKGSARTRERGIGGLAGRGRIRGEEDSLSLCLGLRTTPLHPASRYLTLSRVNSACRPPPKGYLSDRTEGREETKEGETQNRRSPGLAAEGDEKKSRRWKNAGSPAGDDVRPLPCVSDHLLLLRRIAESSRRESKWESRFGESTPNAFKAAVTSLQVPSTDRQTGHTTSSPSHVVSDANPGAEPCC